MSTPPPEVRIALQLPPEQEAGTYASFASIWHDNDGFILDFAVPTMPAQPQSDDATGQQFMVLPTKIVSRVRIPPGQAWEFMKGLNAQLELWEQEHNEPPVPQDS